MRRVEQSRLVIALVLVITLLCLVAGLALYNHKDESTQASMAAASPVVPELDTIRSAQARSRVQRQQFEASQLQAYLDAVHAQRVAEAEAARIARDARRAQFANEQRAARRAQGSRGTAYGPWADLINQYDWPHGTAYRVMMCESRGDANAYNPRSGATGLFQILNGPFDPVENVALAYKMWKSRGWQPWTQCI